MVERESPKLRVEGSIPSGPELIYYYCLEIFFPCRVEGSTPQCSGAGSLSGPELVSKTAIAIVVFFVCIILKKIYKSCVLLAV